MAMKKTTRGEGKLEVLRGPEAEILNQHFAKTGKYSVSAMSEAERAELDQALENQRESEQVEDVKTETRGDVESAYSEGDE